MVGERAETPGLLRKFYDYVARAAYFLYNEGCVPAGIRPSQAFDVLDTLLKTALVFAASMADD